VKLLGLCGKVIKAAGMERLAKGREETRRGRFGYVRPQPGNRSELAHYRIPRKLSRLNIFISAVWERQGGGDKGKVKEKKKKRRYFRKGFPDW